MTETVCPPKSNHGGQRARSGRKPGIVQHVLQSLAPEQAKAVQAMLNTLPPERGDLLRCELTATFLEELGEIIRERREAIRREIASRKEALS
jgi:hypothetical protein